MAEKESASSSDGQQVAQSTYIKPQARLLHDPAVLFEEYQYYARRTREQEKHLESPKLRWREIINRKTNEDAPQIDAGADYRKRKVPEVNFAQEANRLHITDEEWTNASRAMRTASTGAAFYLITTDILGPYGVGFAMGTLGWGPGIALYTVFGFMAGYSGYLIWHVYLGLDSYEFPCRNYGDLAFRTWGTTARYLTNILQALGLLLILGQGILSIHHEYDYDGCAKASSYNPIRPKYKPSFAISPLLHRLPLVVRHRRVLHDPDPHSEKLWPCGQLGRLVEPFGDFHNHGCDGSQPSKLRNQHTWLIRRNC